MKFKGIVKRPQEVMSPVHDEAKTGYLNLNISIREQGEFTGKYLAQDQNKVVFTIPGYQISNLQQNSCIALPSQFDNHKSKYFELEIPAASMPPL